MLVKKKSFNFWRCGLLAGWLFVLSGDLAAEEIFLEMSGVSGGSQVIGHIGEISVLSWSWGVTVSADMTGGGSVGPANFGNLTITKWIDKSSPVLLGRCASGEMIPTLTLTVRKGGSKPAEYYALKMTEVFVSSLTAGGSYEEDRFTEIVSLVFSKVEVTYVEIQPSGSPENPEGYGWDILSNQFYDGGRDGRSVDTDQDGFPDSIDRDDDNDGMSDSYERVHGLNHLVSDSSDDSDGDQLTNLEEFYLGTDPRRADSSFKSTIHYKASSDELTLTWPSSAGLSYRVVSKTSFEDEFSPLGVYLSDGDGTTSISLPSPLLYKMFRVEAIIP